MRQAVGVLAVVGALLACRGGSDEEPPLLEPPVPVADAGHAVDPARARAGCEGDDADACADLARAYEHGRGVSKDMGRAAELYTRGCEKGSARACEGAAYMALAGKGGRAKDLEEARRLYQKSCEGGYGAGCSEWGVTLYKGEGGPKDYEKAFAAYQKGCEAGHARGCSNAGDMLRRATGMSADPTRAAALLWKACELGRVKSCFSLGLGSEKGDGLPKDARQAQRAYERGCNLRDKQCCTNWGAALFDEGQAEAALMAYRRGCAYGDKLGCENAGRMYEEGQADKKSSALAIRYYKKACDLEGGLPLDHGRFAVCKPYRRLCGSSLIQLGECKR